MVCKYISIMTPISFVSFSSSHARPKTKDQKTKTMRCHQILFISSSVESVCNLFRSRKSYMHIHTYTHTHIQTYTPTHTPHLTSSHPISPHLTSSHLTSYHLDLPDQGGQPPRPLTPSLPHPLTYLPKRPTRLIIRFRLPLAI